MKKISYGKQFSADDSIEARVSNAQQIENLKKADELTMPKKKNKFGTNKEEELDDLLSQMNTIEMQRFCIDIGIPPTGTRPFVKRKIKSEFKKFKRNS